MNYSDIKHIRTLCDSLSSSPDWRDVVSRIESSESDFEVDGVRFIDDADIDRIQQKELASDEYVLGCFNASFLSGILGLDSDVIETIQKADPEAVGKMILQTGKLEEVQQEYASCDGYGHHFNGHDFSEEELSVAGSLYHVFDCRN
jgi:hypothetical protein